MQPTRRGFSQLGLEGLEGLVVHQLRIPSELGGGFKYFLFSSLFGEDFQFDQYFSDGLKPPPSEYALYLEGGFCCWSGSRSTVGLQIDTL